MLLCLFQCPAATTPPTEDITLGGGTYQNWSRQEDKRWKKKRRQLEKIERLLLGIVEEIPSDVPEAAPVRQAEEVLAQAKDQLNEDAAPVFDWRTLSADVAQAERALAQARVALAHYQARKIAEAEDQDDEDFLLLMA